jgi:hypothetical protein
MILSKGGLRDCPKGTISIPSKNGYKREQNKQKFVGHQRNLARYYRMVLLLPGGFLDWLQMEEFLRLSCVLLEQELRQEEAGFSEVMFQSERLRETFILLIHLNFPNVEGGQGDSPFVLK